MMLHTDRGARRKTLSHRKRPRRGASWRRFVRGTRAGAAAIAAVAISLMTVGGAALITDHAWLVDQRDTLKKATDAAAIAATIEMAQLLDADAGLSDDDLRTGLEAVARRYIELNLTHLPPDRFARARETLAIELTIDRGANRVHVAAEADLGGTLIARTMPLLGEYAGPEAMQTHTTVECAVSTVEVALALDVTASMHGPINRAQPATGDNQRLNVVVEAAKLLVDELRSACDGSSIAVGVVPWDKTVRVPNVDDWRRLDWAETGGRINPLEWAGCVEDRAHDTNPLDEGALSDSASLSLEDPESNPFPAFVYPNTANLPVAPMAALIRDAFPNIAGTHTDRNLEHLLRRLRDNDWGVPRSGYTPGGNAHCTSTALRPLDTDLDAVDRTLDDIRTSKLWGGGTLAHLGVTWGRRLLAPSWRSVWGGNTHPVDPAEREAAKLLVLLTDGANALVDERSTLPGKLDARHLRISACLPIGNGFTPARCRQGEYGSFYSAVGRLGAGAADHGYYYPDWGVTKNLGTGNSAEASLSALMKRSCALAREEGVTVYTIGVVSGGNARLRDALIACAGAPATAEANRRAFYFEGNDRESIERAFREIARRTLTVRRLN